MSPRLAVAMTAALAVLLPAAAGCGGEQAGQAVPGVSPTASSPESESSPAEPESSAADPADSPAADIEGIEIVDYPNKSHVVAPQRVGYDQAPPFGGPHDAIWAGCNGAIYATAVRNEHMVHSLEHGAVWIAYDPAVITGGTLASLQAQVTGQPYLMMSPYPGLDRPLSLQSWGHRLKLDAADDPRLVAFIRTLRANPSTHPEPGATCDPGPAGFDVTAPPPFDPTPPGPDAVPVT